MRRRAAWRPTTTAADLPGAGAGPQAWLSGGCVLRRAPGPAAVSGVLLGLPTLKLGGDNLAIVTLGFGEIVRLLIVNLGQPFNLIHGAKGIGPNDSIHLPGLDLGRPLDIGSYRVASVTLYYYLFLVLATVSVGVCHRPQDSRIGRAWGAIRDNEVVAAAMGIDTRRMKLMAFGTGAGFGGVAGALFAAFQGFVSPEAFTLQESVIVVAMVVFGGARHVRGVVLGAVLLSALPEVLRDVTGPLQAMTEGRLDAGILRPLLVSLVMIVTMLWRPEGLWPAPSHGRTQSASSR